MNDLASAFSRILTDSDSLLHTPLTEQQRTFVNHIRRTAQVWLGRTESIPHSLEALYQIVPTLGDALTQQVIALYGYAKLMLDHPVSFEYAPLTHAQQTLLTSIVQWGMALAKRLDSLKADSLAWRMAQRHQTPQQFNLAELLLDQLPIYRYWLAKDYVLLDADLSTPTADVIARPYHVGELVKHLLLTLAAEGLATVVHEQRRLWLTLEAHNRYTHLVIQAEPIQMNNLDFLFVKDGRAMYIQQLERDGGQINIQSTHNPFHWSIFVSLPA